MTLFYLSLLKVQKQSTNDYTITKKLRRCDEQPSVIIQQEFSRQDSLPNYSSDDGNDENINIADFQGVERHQRDTFFNSSDDDEPATISETADEPAAVTHNPPSTLGQEDTVLPAASTNSELTESSCSSETDNEDFSLADAKLTVKENWLICTKKHKYDQENSMPFTGKQPGAYVRNVYFVAPGQVRKRSAGRPPKRRRIPKVEFFPNPQIIGKRPFEVFMLYFQDIMEFILDKTNKLLRSQKPAGFLNSHPVLTDITTDQMKRFFAIIIEMGHTVRSVMAEYWSIGESKYLPWFHNTLPSTVFFRILRYLCFTDKEPPTDGMKRRCDYDNLWMLREVFDMIRNRSRELYNPTKHLAVDADINTFQKEAIFEENVSKKGKPFGIKVYKLCDDSAYTFNMSIYMPNNVQVKDNETVTEKIVINLIQGLENCGHHLYMDKCFTSLRLIRRLKSLGILACGTISCNRSDIPSVLKRNNWPHLGLGKGEIASRVTRDGITCTVFFDRRPVTLLSSIHGPSKKGRYSFKMGLKEYCNKPLIINDFNQHMYYVYCSNQMVSRHSLRWRWKKWTKKLFFYLFETLLANAYIAYRSVNEMDNQRHSLKWFREQVCIGLVASSESGGSARCIDVRGPQLERLHGRHFPRRDAQGKSKKCMVCSVKKQRSESIWRCESCYGVSLCVAPCFELYHTQEDLTRA